MSQSLQTTNKEWSKTNMFSNKWNNTCVLTHTHTSIRHPRKILTITNIRDAYGGNCEYWTSSSRAPTHKVNRPNPDPNKHTLHKLRKPKSMTSQTTGNNNTITRRKLTKCSNSSNPGSAFHSGSWRNCTSHVRKRKQMEIFCSNRYTF